MKIRCQCTEYTIPLSPFSPYSNLKTIFRTNIDYVTIQLDNRFNNDFIKISYRNTQLYAKKKMSKAMKEKTPLI